MKPTRSVALDFVMPLSAKVWKVGMHRAVSRTNQVVALQHSDPLTVERDQVALLYV